MNHKEKLQLRDPVMAPIDEMLEQTLGDSYAAYQALQAALPGLDMEQAWQWYTPYKAWFAKGQHSWTTPRGAKKEKNLYWLYVYEGYFSVAVWFKKKDRPEVLLAAVSEQTKRRIREPEETDKLPTFPVVCDITTTAALSDIYALLDCKKRLEK